MSRPYTHRGHNGFSFLGNRMHPEDMHWVNAQLAGLVEPPHTRVYKPAASHRRGFRIEHSSTILERLRGRPELLAGMAELVIRTELPDVWTLGEQDGREELIRERHIQLMQALGEAAVEAAA